MVSSAPNVALDYLGVGFMLLCALVPGLWMLLFPEKAFTTATKPRWLGVPFLLLGLYMAWLILAGSTGPRSDSLSPRLPVPRAGERHTWQAAAMRWRVRAGMKEPQVTRLLGRPFYVMTSTPPGDVTRAADLCEGYYGQDGPLFVYYYQGKGGEVVCGDELTLTDASFYDDGH